MFNQGVVIAAYLHDDDPGTFSCPLRIFILNEQVLNNGARTRNRPLILSSCNITILYNSIIFVPTFVPSLTFVAFAQASMGEKL